MLCLNSSLVFFSRNRDNRGKRGGLGARPNISPHIAAHTTIIPLKSDKESAFWKYPLSGVPYHTKITKLTVSLASASVIVTYILYSNVPSSTR